MPPCLLAIVLIEIHDAMFNRQVFGYSTAIAEFLGLLGESRHFGFHITQTLLALHAVGCTLV